MNELEDSRRRFLKNATLAAGSLLLPSGIAFAAPNPNASPAQNDSSPAEYIVRIQSSPVEIAPKVIISTITYNGQFPGPLIRFQEGQPVTVDIFNDTDTPEQLHWHGQKVPVDVDGAAEEGTPYIPAHGKRRISFTPGPSGLRFYHTHNRAGANLSAGQYTGQVGPVYIEPETRTRPLRSRSLPHPEGVRAHFQPRRRHGHGFPLASAAESKLWKKQANRP